MMDRRTCWRAVVHGTTFALALAAFGIPVQAQEPDAQEPGAAAGPGRQLLEQRLRSRLEQVVQRRLGLTSEQMVKLRETNRRWAPQRRALIVREGAIRREMRDELRPGASADQQHVATLIDSLFTLERSRLDVLQGEQRELATYLTPEQRVRYYALQEQIRRRIMALRQHQQGLGGGAAGEPLDGEQP